MSEKPINENLLGALVEMSKRGERGEKENAMRALKKLCGKYQLDIEEVLHGNKIEEYRINYHSAQYLEVMTQIACRYAHLTMDDTIRYNQYDKYIVVKTTKQKYVETLNAWEVLLPLYKKEKKLMEKVFFHGFLDKHGLYYQRTEADWKKIKRRKKKDPEPSEEEMKVRRMGSEISRHLEDAEINPRLEAPK